MFQSTSSPAKSILRSEKKKTKRKTVLFKEDNEVIDSNTSGSESTMKENDRNSLNFEV